MNFKIVSHVKLASLNNKFYNLKPANLVARFAMKSSIQNNMQSNNLSIFKKKFEDIDGVTVENFNESSLPVIKLETLGQNGQVSQRVYISLEKGAQVLSYIVYTRDNKKHEVINTQISKEELNTRERDTESISGGIPLCVPFAGKVPEYLQVEIPGHGLPRQSKQWQLISVTRDNKTGILSVKFFLDANQTGGFGEITREIKLIPADNKNNLAGKLQDSVTVRNPSQKEPLKYPLNLALHTYLGISNIKNIEITGIPKNTKYWDKVNKKNSQTVSKITTPVSLKNEKGGLLDLIFDFSDGLKNKIFKVTDKERQTETSFQIELKKNGKILNSGANIVMWSPKEDSRGQRDKVLCVEPAVLDGTPENLNNNSIQLEPLETFTMTVSYELQELRA